MRSERGGWSYLVIEALGALLAVHKLCRLEWAKVIRRHEKRSTVVGAREGKELGTGLYRFS